MNIITNSHEADRRIAELLIGWTVGITLLSGDCFDMIVNEADPENFVALVGPRVTFDDFWSEPYREHEVRRVQLIEIERLECY